MDSPSWWQKDVDAIFSYDWEEQSLLLDEKPWSRKPRNPTYFKRVKISALALLKMMIHASSGGHVEVIGLLQGKIVGHAFVVVDAFAVPVQGAETRVDAQADATSYMIDYTYLNSLAGRLEYVTGWYHSHPGYGCWLSGVDVATQMFNQRLDGPYLAVVIDPTRTVSAGRVEIGAFMTFPQGHEPPDEPAPELITIPLDKIEDFDLHRKQYYSLDITYFKSSLDSYLFGRLCWMKILSYLGNADDVVGQISELAERMELAEAQIGVLSLEEGSESKKEESPVAKIARDSAKIAVEQLHALISKVIKGFLFNRVGQSRNRSRPS